ncbi:hypothetical protein [Fervidobacterium sp.]
MKKVLIYVILLATVLVSLISTSCTQKVVYKPQDEQSSKTKVLDTQMLSAVEFRGADLVFSQESEFAKTLRIGDILAAGVSEKTPYGYLAKVASIRRENGKIIVETENAKLEEAIKDGEVKLDVILTEKNIKSVELAPGVKILYEEAPLWITNPISFNRGYNYIVDLDKNPATTYDQVQISGNIAISSRLKFEASFGSFKVKKVNLEFVDVMQSGSLRVSTSPNFSYNKQIPLFRYPIATVNYAPVTMTVFGIPLVITPRITIYFSLNGGLSANLTAQIQQTLTGNVGLSYDSGKFKPINGLMFELSPIEYQGGANAYVNAEVPISGSVVLNGIVSAYCDIVGGLGFVIDYPYWSLTGRAYAVAGLDVSLIDYSKEFKLLDWSQVLKSGRF